jgi:hypothetical protein
MAHQLKNWLGAALAVALAFAVFAIGCGGSSHTPGNGDGIDASLPGRGLCAAPTERCNADVDCCAPACVAGRCSAGLCASDGQACASDAACCSGACVNGACEPLSTSCKTTGNSCSQSSECCSQLCAGGVCSSASSYCIQTGDSCTAGPDCCGGVCTIAQGRTVGMCGSPPAGATFCNGGTDGTVCGACTDCCSRLCAPYGLSGVKICQPAEGCHIDGDLCTADADCCGAPGTGLPGDGNVHCDIQPGFVVGICRNPTGCNPEGNVCHYKNYACSISSARNDCCGAPGNSSACQLDKLGVPRCHAPGACVNPAGDCAFDADCCNGGHCVPGPGGKLVCQSECSPSTGPCTVAADCCRGLQCRVPQGSTSGTCGPPPPPPQVYDAGPPPVPDGGSCALYGQSCTQASDCCNGVPCTTATGLSCSAGQTCTCMSPIQ